jgi:transposase InsO family protein
LAKEMGVSRQCVSHWVRRYLAEGEDGLHDRSSRPHTSPTRTSPRVETAGVELRTQQRRGPDWIGAELGVPARTVSRILRRHQLPYLRARPAQLVHMDVKKIGRIPDGGGRRAYGRGARTRDRTTKIGFDYVHSLVDDHSRLAYSEVLPDEKGPTCAGFLARAADHFAAHGIDRIERIMTDNAWAYRWSLREVIIDLRARQVFIKPHCPWQNGKVKRFNRTLQTEWAYRQIFHSNDKRPAALAPWLDHNNTRRRHSALAGLPPASRLSPT